MNYSREDYIKLLPPAPAGKVWTQLPKGSKIPEGAFRVNPPVSMSYETALAGEICTLDEQYCTARYYHLTEAPFPHIAHGNAPASDRTLLNLNHPEVVAAIREACEFASDETITHIDMEIWPENPVLRIYTKKS